MIFLYNLLFPIAFLFFLPGMLLKLIRRGGEKRGFGERFAIFAKTKAKRLEEFKGAVWVHSVSVGETTIALGMIEVWLERSPDMRFVLSTTTTTGQALAHSRAPKNVEVIFCPIDFLPFTRFTVKRLQPSMLVIFETEIWPNLIGVTHSIGVPVVLVNARISDKSAAGYRHFSFFFAPVLRKLSLICAQTELDAERFKAVDETLEPVVCGNMKFDQKPPAKIADVDLTAYFGNEPVRIIMAASTHFGEEKLIAAVFKRLRKSRPDLRLVIVPRHAERGGEISAELNSAGLKLARRSLQSDGAADASPVDVLLADTTGEMLSFIATSAVVVMGKSLAGHKEGHNILEPAILAKPVVTGRELRNFRFVLKTMVEADAVATVADEAELEQALAKLLDDPEAAAALGKRAEAAVAKQKGAIKRTIELCEKLLR
ncbi:MAG: 3-deoxy-D-manno-octulosonic acid transferase [Victivallales bacterium]|nr:3-deoxy-D-manno-octulosonic acid transferase [Victivallales bacterium]